MKGKWFLYIILSVFSLDITDSRTDSPIYESQTTRPSARRKVLKLGSSKNLGLADHLSSTDNRKEASAYLPDVSVTCSTSGFVVRVKNSFYGFGADAEELTLGGTCKSNGVLRPYGDLLFTYHLTECNGKRETPLGYLNYKFVLHYEPSPNRFPRRAHRVNVDIECRFSRYQHVYQLAVRPTWKTPAVHRRLKGRSDDFRVQLMDDAWTMPAQSQVYLLGRTVNFQVSALHLPHGGKLFINTCYATTSNGFKPSATYPIIDNFGCMLESQRNPGVSRFVSPRTDDTIRFSFSAFQFTSDPDTQVNIHCKLFVTSEEPSPVRKSCTYSEKRWRALTGPDRICKCCDSECATSKPRRAMLEGSASSEPLLVSDSPVRPSPGSVNDDDRDVIWFETKANGQIDELLALEDPSEGFDVEKYGDEEKQTATLAQEEKQYDGGEEDTPGKLIREEMSGYRNLEGSLKREWSWLESEGSKLEKWEGSGEEEGVHPQEDEEEEEEESLGSGMGEGMLPPEGGVSQSKMEFGVGEDQSLEVHSEKEEGEKEGRDGSVSREEDRQKAPFSETEKEELLSDYGGLEEMGIVGGGETVWRFKWR